MKMTDLLLKLAILFPAIAIILVKVDPNIVICAAKPTI
jgi:hypothetical protein